MIENPVTNNEADGQFEITVGEEKAILQYRRTDANIRLIHTEVPNSLRERGLGTQLVRAALKYAHGNQLRIIPICQFVRAYLQKHPEER